MIDKNAELRSKFQLIDHHATALPLAEKFEWCEVSVEEDNMFKFPNFVDKREKVKSSGTSLFYNFLRNKHIPNISPQLKVFAETVRMYDTWEWSTVYNENHPKQLNDLLYIIGREKFVERFTDNPFPTFNETEKTILEIEEHRVNKYIWYKKKEVKEIGWHVGGKQYKVAYVFAESNVSLLGNEIAKEYGDKIDFVAIIDVGNGKVSLRGVHDSIALGTDVAKYYGGGGHPKSSGFEFSKGLQTKLMIDIVMQEKGTDYDGSPDFLEAKESK